MSKWIRRCARYFKYDMKMYNKFVLIYFICTVTPFLLLSMVVLRVISGKMSDLEMRSARAVMEQANTRLHSQLQNIIEETYAIYLDNDLYEYLSTQTVKDNEYQTYLLEDKLSTIVKGGRVQNASLYLEDPGKISKRHYRCQSMSSAQNMSWYQQLAKSEKRSLWHFAGSSGYYVSSIYNKYDARRLIGYIVMTFSRSSVLDILKDMCITENTEAFITDESGEIVICAKSGGNTEKLEAILAAEQAGSGGEREAYFLLQQTVENKQIPGLPEWTLTIAVPRQELTHIADSMALAVAPAVGLCLILSCLLIAFTIRSITRRIDKLNRNMQRPQTGDFSVNDIAPGRDEISELRRNFNFMLNTVEQLLEEKVQAEEHQKDMELCMLQAQINPHFLYNTLDMINWAAISRTPEEIPVITGMLARFYKLSLSSGARIVRLADELEHVRLYIGLQNRRYDFVLDLKEEIPEELAECACLKILLQPIVENAVLHGIFEKDIPKGQIFIRAYRGDGGAFFIEIEDDGVGMDEEKLRMLKNADPETKLGGYGLANIEERIRLCYGNGYGLTFESRKNEFTRVTIRMRYVEYEESLKQKMKL